MKSVFFLITFLFSIQILQAQNVRSVLSTEEVEFIQHAFNKIKSSDQLYRPMLQAKTLDPVKLAKLDSLYKLKDPVAVLKYQSSITNELTNAQRDSLLLLQRQLDFTNHMIMRGIWDRYGWISKEIVEENNFVQNLLLLHPPVGKDQITEYTENYKAKLLPEVKASRMPALVYASFVDNMHAKILREPQVYGTNNQFDPKTRTILPPIISNLEKSNQARKELGLPPLKDGEYRLSHVKY